VYARDFSKKWANGGLNGARNVLRGMIILGDGWDGRQCGESTRRGWMGGRGTAGGG